MSKFRTIEVSDPKFERDGLRFITVKSENLRGRGDITVFVPKQSEQLDNLPVILLLHGIYGSHWCWAMKGGAHITAQYLIDEAKIKPCIIAMPSDGLKGDGTNYVPHYNADFEQWIVEDVPKVLQEVLPQVSMQSPLFIAGLSMGGYGALRLGSKYPDRFKGISAHSGTTHFKHILEMSAEDLSDAEVADAERYSYKIMLKNKDRLPPIRFDCGTEDGLLLANRLLHERLTAADIPHTYQEFPGDHTWPYWEEHLEDTLLFFDGLL